MYTNVFQKFEIFYLWVDDLLLLEYVNPCKGKDLFMVSI